MERTLNSSAGATKTVKFLYSYGGKIIPRPTDGKLRYVGGHTRVLAVDRAVTYSELMVKFAELSGSSMNLKCKLPSEDMDVLISIKSDEDLKNVIEEYARASPKDKVRALLFPINLTKKVSPPSSPMSCFEFPTTSPPYPRTYRRCPPGVGCHMIPRRYCERKSPSQFYRVPGWGYSRSQ